MLASLDADVLAHIVRWADSPSSISRLDRTARLFHLGAPRSPVEEGLRLRAEAAGREVGEALPEGEASRVQLLLWEERRAMTCTRAVADSGYTHSAFVDAGGQLLTCGSSSCLGQGAGVVKSEVPRAVAGLSGVRVISVAVGGGHTLALSEEGAVYSFGSGAYGQLGHGDQADQHTPRRIESLGDTRISAVAVGGGHSLALGGAGELYSFGRGGHGQLGHGDTTHQLTPRRIEALRGTPISAVAAGGAHTLAVSGAGDVYSFGEGGRGQLGHGDRMDQHTPRRIEALHGVRACGVAAGGYVSLVVSAAGRVYSFGHGVYGALGHGDQADQLTPRLTEALRGVRVSAVAAGGGHALALSEGKVYSFGWGGRGQLGHGYVESASTPRVITGLRGVRSIAAGVATTLPVDSTGAVVWWGHGAALGLGLADQLPPRRLGSLVVQRA